MTRKSQLCSLISTHPEEIKDLCPIVITTIDCRAKDDTAGNKYEFDKNIEGDENNDYAHFFTNVGVAYPQVKEGNLRALYDPNQLCSFGERLSEWMLDSLLQSDAHVCTAG